MATRKTLDASRLPILPYPPCMSKYVNPAFVREVTLGDGWCKLTPVRATVFDDAQPAIYTHAESPTDYAACIGVHKFFEKQRVAK